MKTHLYLVVAIFSLVAASLEAWGVSIGDKLNLSGPDDVSFSLLIIAAPPAGIAGSSFIAQDSETGVGAVVKPTARGMRITVDDFTRNKIYTFRVKDGVTTCEVRVKSSEPDECATCAADAEDVALPSEQRQSDPNAVPATSSRKMLLASALRGSGEDFPLSGQKAVVDVLVAFDRGAKAWAESDEWPGGDTVEEFADYAVAKMNYVLEKSQLLDRLCYRLVGTVEVDATYDVINESLLDALRLRSSGALAPVGAAREKCGADTITLLVDRDRNKSTTSGKGYEYLSNSWSFASFDAAGYTCNICDVKTVYERYTMSHETGHNMGCGHSDRQGSSSGPGCNPYSCGYHFQDASGVKLYTVMGYDHTSPESGTYAPVPYFSSPDITPDELGVPVGTPTNNNRLTILNNYKNVAAWREHVVPYEWDVRFLDGNGNDIEDGSFFTGTLYVTLTNSNPDATIHYTTDGSIPNVFSPSCSNGSRLTILDTATITACAVTNGVALSFRKITVNEGIVWSGESGQNGNGRWIADSSVLAWNDSTTPFNYSSYPSVNFSDLDGILSASVTVEGAISPYATAFTATETSYTFVKGAEDAVIHLRDARFAPSGDLTFNLPVLLDAVAFTNPANHTVTFNAPFGQEVYGTTGYCTNMIGIGASGSLVVSPGEGKTQIFDKLNTAWFFSTAKFCVGKGTVVFNGPSDSVNGVVGNTGIFIGNGGNVVFNATGKIAGIYSSISGEGTAVCKSVASANSLKLTDSAWKGTLAFEGLAADTTTQNFQFENYGNSGSKVLLRNCEISYLKNNNATFQGTLVLEGDGALRFGNNGYSSNWNVVGALEGDGSIFSSSQHTQTYVFNTATNYTGSMSVNASGGKGRRVVFGTVSAAGDIPTQSATITVKPAATASIGGGATWYAHHGVEISGTLLVKGADAKLDCNASASMGLKLDADATLRFDAADASLVFGKAPQFSSGTVNVAFATGVAPTNGMILAVWPDGTAPGGDFAFSDSALEKRWVLEKTSTGLVVGNAPLPETVTTSITVRYFGDNGWEDKALDFDLTTGWITRHYPSLDTPGAVAAKYDEDAANGAKVWQCYMLGLDPTDAESKVSLSMTVVNQTIRFAVEGLGETHPLDGVNVYWYMKTSTNLVTDASFSRTRDSAFGLSPSFSDHTMPDKPTPSATETADALFYKITVSFTAD